MKFTAREDVEAPIDHVFGQITDFPAFERSMMRRGADVKRLPGPDAPAPGARWEVRFQFRGKERVVVATLESVERDAGLTIGFVGTATEGGIVVDLVPLSRSRTRINVTADVSAKTLAAKLLFKSMRFGKSRMDQRFGTALLGFAEDLERRYKAGA